MNTGRITVFCLALLFAVCLVSCGSGNPPKRNASVFDFNVNSEITIGGQTYDEDVQIIGENGRINFINCTFNGNIYNDGGIGAQVMIWEDCTFADSKGCFITADIGEATIETSLPKFIIFCEAPEVDIGKSGSVIAPADAVIRVNGREYRIEDAEKFVVDDGSFNVVPYEGQEAGMHSVGIWTENGETVQMHTAIAEAN